MTSEVPVKDEMDMEQLLAEAAPTGTVGSIVTAYVVQSNEKGLLVDVGLKVEGFIPLSEFRSLSAPPAVGETFPVLIKRLSGLEGHPIVSWKEAREKANWDEIVKAKESQTPIEGHLIRSVRGGFIIDIGLEAFLPMSHVNRRPTKDTKALIGKKMLMLVLDMDVKKGSVILSRRAYLEKEANAKREEILKTIKVGDVHVGKVTNLTNFGAFVEMEGVEGLLRLADLSWSRSDKLQDVLSVGEDVQVKILKIDSKTRKISLGRKQLLPHPWEDVDKKFPVDNVFKGKVSSITDFGAFVELAPGIEGLVHQSEFSWHERWVKPSKFVKMGDEVSVYVLSCDRPKEKLALSLRRAEKNPWVEAAELYKVGSRIKGTVTHIVPFGAFIRISNGVEGLLRTEEISWTKSAPHPKEVVSVGQEIEVVVLEINPSSERISLGLKQLTPDPYAKLKPGNKVEGKVTRLTSSGAVVEIKPDVQGFLPVSEISSEGRIERPSDVLAEGQTIQAVITKVQRKSKKIDLSIRKHEQREERRLIKKYRGTGEGVTLGEMTEWNGSQEENGNEKF